MSLREAVGPGVRLHRLDHQHAPGRSPAGPDRRRSGGLRACSPERPTRGPRAVRSNCWSQPSGRPSSVPSQASGALLFVAAISPRGYRGAPAGSRGRPRRGGASTGRPSRSWSMNSGQTEPLKWPGRPDQVRPLGVARRGCGPAGARGRGRARTRLAARQAGRAIRSMPMYGRRGAGTSTEPSGRWYVSRIAATIRARASPEPLSVWTSSGFAPGSGR